MKRLKTGIGCLIFTVFFLFPWQSQAQISYVYDQADLLSEEQEQNLQEWAEKKKEAEKQNFVFLTSDDTGNQDTKTYADHFYDTHGFEKQDGILFLIDMDNRQLTISTTGSMRAYMTDKRVEAVLEEVKSYASEGAYDRVFTELGEKTLNYLQKQKQQEEKTDFAQNKASVKKNTLSATEVGVSCLIGIISGGIFFFVILKKYNRKPNLSSSYRENTELFLKRQNDDLIHHTVTRRKIVREETSENTAADKADQNNEDHGGGSVGF